MYVLLVWKTNFRLSLLGVDHSTDKSRAFWQLHLRAEQCTTGFRARPHIQRWVLYRIVLVHFGFLMKFKWYYRRIYLWFVLPPPPLPSPSSASSTSAGCFSSWPTLALEPKPEICFTSFCHHMISWNSSARHNMRLLNEAKQICVGLLPWPLHKFSLNELLTLFDVNMYVHCMCVYILACSLAQANDSSALTARRTSHHIFQQLQRKLLSFSLVFIVFYRQPAAIQMEWQYSVACYGIYS